MRFPHYELTPRGRYYTFPRRAPPCSPASTAVPRAASDVRDVLLLLLPLGVIFLSPLPGIRQEKTSYERVRLRVTTRYDGDASCIPLRSSPRGVGQPAICFVDLLTLEGVITYLYAIMLLLSLLHQRNHWRFALSTIIARSTAAQLTVLCLPAYEIYSTDAWRLVRTV